MKYARSLAPFTLEFILAAAMDVEQDVLGTFFYAEPRIRYQFQSLENPMDGLYASLGVFGGVGVNGSRVEEMFGGGLNVGYQLTFFEVFFVDASVGLQYPDFPLHRSFRIHYWIEEINYISLRTALSFGFTF